MRPGVLAEGSEAVLSTATANEQDLWRKAYAALGDVLEDLRKARRLAEAAKAAKQSGARTDV